MLLGKINQDIHKNICTSIIDSKNERDVMINPRLICNKEEKKEKILSLIDVAYNEIIENRSNFNNNDGNILGCGRNIYRFNREEESESEGNYNLICKVHTILPNVNLELKQIKNLSLSNTELNKYLVLKSYENELFDPNKKLRSGFLTMSQEHRLITLRDDTKDKGHFKNSQSIKRIMFGIWLNLKDECPSFKKIDLDNLLHKYKPLIYQKCFEYIQLTSNIDFVYSPSPDQSVFLLVIFYKTMQCHYEVTIIPNEEDKCFTSQSGEDTQMFPQEFSPNWLILKNKYILKTSDPLSIDLKKEVFKGNIMKMSEYLAKKTGIKTKNSLTKSTNLKMLTTPSKLSEINYYKDNLNEIFDNSCLENDDMDDLYNYPLIIPVNFKIKDSINKSNNKKDTNPPKCNNMTEQTNKMKKNCIKLSKSNSNLKENATTILIKSNEELSSTSTNNISNKISLVSSKNSFNKTRNRNCNCIPSNYITIINQQAETIKTLQNKISVLELNINSVLNELNIRNNQTDNKKENNSEKELKTSPLRELPNGSFSDSLHKQSFKSSKKIHNEQTNTSIKVPFIIYNNSIFSEDEN